MFNSYVRDYDNYGLKPIGRSKLEDLINKVGDDKSEAHKYYMDGKLGTKSFDEEFGLVAVPHQVNYTNTRGEKLTIDTDDLDKIVKLVQEEMNASPSQHVSWRKIRQKAIGLGLTFSPSKDYKELVYRRLDELQQQPVQKQTPVDTELFKQAYGSELGQLQIQKRFIQNKNRSLNKLKRELTDHVIFNRELLSAVQEPIRVSDSSIKFNDKPVKDSQMVLVISDWHLGARIDLESNHYNLKIATERINRLFNQVINHIRVTKPQSVMIVNLGDLIEGAQMRKNQAFSIELSLGQQIKTAGELQANFIRNLVTTFPKINFKFTELEGNHDRFAPSKKDELPQDGVSLLGRTLVELGCKDLDNLEVINPTNEYRYIYSVDKYNLMFVHGDRDKLSDNNVLGKLSTFTNTPLDALIGGHLHSIQIREQGNDQFICQSGSLIGPSDYSESLGVTSSPSQLLIDINQYGLSPQIILV